MDSTVRGRLAALMTATSVAVGIAGGMAAQAQAAVEAPTASYCGQECAPGGGGPNPVVIANNNNGPKTVAINNQTFLPILDLILQGNPGNGGIEEPIYTPTSTPAPLPLD
ncbi:MULTISPECIES: hypothetical protein [unclassified Streptomyces]|uniref:hypothetical protein n=1 Tax=unclassified Streptomyces TaxID=2593676 RepID=UPI00332F30B2